MVHSPGIEDWDKDCKAKGGEVMKEQVAAGYYRVEPKGEKPLVLTYLANSTRDERLLGAQRDAGVAYYEAKMREIFEEIDCHLRFTKDAVTGDLIEGFYDDWWQSLKDKFLKKGGEA